MNTVKALAGWYEVDGQSIYLDSKSEALFIRRLVRDNFSNKWRRPNGVAFGSHRYTPDFELSIDWNGKSVRAHVEYKSSSATQFGMSDRARALAALHYYGSNPLLLLYVNKTRRWYYIDPMTKHAISCAAPQPSGYSMCTYGAATSGITTTNKYGRRYKNNTKALVGNAVADGLETGIKLLFGSPKPKKERRSTSRRKSRLF